jgi:hypothetical protein
METYKVKRNSFTGRLTRKTKRNPSLTPLQQFATFETIAVNSYSGRYPSQFNWDNKQLLISVPGARYIVRPTIGADGFMIGGQHGRDSCAILLIHTDEKGKRFGDLHSFRKGGDCAISPIRANIRAPPTKLLALAAWTLCYQYKLKYMVLDDLSYIECRNNKRIVLADMYLLKYGKTWYQSILPLEAKPNKGIIRPWTENQQIAKTNRWGDVVARLPVHLQEILPIKGRDDELAMIVFRDFFRIDGFCDIFHDNHFDFMRASGLEISRNYSWKTPPITSPLPPA